MKEGQDVIVSDVTSINADDVADLNEAIYDVVNAVEPLMQGRPPAIIAYVFIGAAINTLQAAPYPVADKIECLRKMAGFISSLADTVEAGLDAIRREGAAP